jgi:hypothetical protein
MSSFASPEEAADVAAARQNLAAEFSAPVLHAVLIRQKGVVGPAEPGPPRRSEVEEDRRYHQSIKLANQLRGPASWSALAVAQCSTGRTQKLRMQTPRAHSSPWPSGASPTRKGSHLIHACHADPGWTVEINNVRAPMLRADVLFCGVKVPAGSSRGGSFRPFSIENLWHAAKLVMLRKGEPCRPRRAGPTQWHAGKTRNSSYAGTPKR